MTPQKATKVPIHYSWQRGFAPLFPRLGAPDSDGYSIANETVGCWHRCRGSRERKQLAPMRLDMPIFKLTDPGVGVMYMLWHFNVDAFLNPLLEAGGPTSHWIGPETLVELTMEGRNFNTLADSGSQVNTITPALVQQYGFPVLPLEDLVDYPLNLMGLGGKHTSPLGFVILHVQVQGIAGYDKDTVFLVVPDESELGQRVPLVVGTFTIGRIINVIREGKIDSLAMLWSTARVVRLLSCWLGMAVPASEGAETLVEGASGGFPEGNIDEPVTV